MAGIGTTLSITDRMMAPLQRINAQLNTMKSSFDSLDSASEKAFSPDDVEDMRNSIDAMTSDIDQVTDAMEEVDDATKKASDSAGGLEGALGKVLSVAAAVAAVKFGADWLQGSMELADAQNQVEAQLKTVLANMGAEADAFDMLKAKASELQKTTIYGDETYLAGAAELSTYLKDANAVAVLMDTLSNYATGMTGGGEVDITSMTDMATQLGKVLIGSYDGIKKKGFEVSDAQKEIIENGTDMQKALVIDEVISEGWAGLAESMTNLPSGQIKQFKNAWGDFREEIGNQVYPKVAELFAKIEEHMPQIQRLITSMVELLGPVVDVLMFLIDIVADFGDVILVAAGAWVAYKIAQNAATWATKAFDAALTAIDAHPVLAIVSAVLGLIVAIKDLWNNCKPFRNWVIDAFESILNAGYQMTKGIAEAVADMWEDLKPIFEVLSAVIPSLKPASMAIDMAVNNPDLLDDKYKEIIDTMEGWREDEIDPVEAANVEDYLGKVSDSSDETAANTSSLASASEAVLAYLKDIAEREAINKFTTAEVKIDLGGVSNTINNNGDIDGFVNYLAERTSEALAVTAAKSARI